MERVKRTMRFDKLIDFVKRRDLSRDYINTYEKKKNEVWKFANSNGSVEENSIVDDDLELNNDVMEIDTNMNDGT